MNPDLEEVGTLVTAGLAAHEVDAVSIPARHDTETHANCLISWLLSRGSAFTHANRPASSKLSRGLRGNTEAGSP
jgi:hypothetical protein